MKLQQQNVQQGMPTTTKSSKRLLTILVAGPFWTPINTRHLEIFEFPPEGLPHTGIDRDKVNSPGHARLPARQDPLRQGIATGGFQQSCGTGGDLFNQGGVWMWSVRQLMCFDP